MAEALGKVRKEQTLRTNTSVELIEVADGNRRALLQGHKFSVRALAFSPDGKTLATGSDDQSIKLWDPVTGLEKCTLKGHEGGVSSLAFSGDGAVLVSGSRDGTMRIWEGPR
jgi:WD40 repeat protein